MIQFISCLFKKYIENENGTFMGLVDISFRQVICILQFVKKNLA